MSQATPSVDQGGVTIERREGVLLIGLDRPAKRNALTPIMSREISLAYEEYEQDPGLRCAVLFGHGQAFCAGADVTTLGDTLDENSPDPADQIDPFQVSGRRLSKPLVSAVHGICFAGGLELALAGDIIVAAEGTKFGQPETVRGLFAFAGGAVRWVERVGWGNAQRYLLTGEPLLADEALRIGLVQEVVPAESLTDRALSLAASIAAAAPIGVRDTLAVGRISINEGSERAFEEMLRRRPQILRSADAAEGLTSFLERRGGRYTGA